MIAPSVGIASAATFAGELPGRLYVIAAVAVCCGVLVTAAAAFMPAWSLRRLPAGHLLAEE